MPKKKTKKRSPKIPHKQGNIREKKQGDPEVGYKKPPVGRRFQPGQSGNPKGRPPGQTLTTIVRKMLDKVCPKDKEGRLWSEIIAQGTVALAVKGNSAAIREIWNRMEGRVPQDVNLGGTVGLLEEKIRGMDKAQRAKEIERIQKKLKKNK